ncbi:hypothetical protein [Gracilibacillus sp. YIM 98692]|uniref:hypothetical protein n=1 Tax=Gracilibacillus sp. YIM 98692 TaxID=2663532 RepID=UPI0013D541C4|nr:hypothetical protein [Gracilibacillus sp. YIM 98692]
MKKLLVLILLFFLMLIFSACEANQLVAPDQETLTHDVEQNGLALQATIKVGKDINVDASITNTSSETIIYNGRCGIPFRISVQKEDAHANLVPRNRKGGGCTDVFDPDDLREMKPNETFDKKITFKREVSLTNKRTVPALNGEYKVFFSFEMHEKERFLSSLPIKLTNNKETEIMTVDQAKKMAKTNKEVKRWFDEHEKQDMPIESEDAILSEGMWTVAFHAIYQDGANRIVINMNAETGEVKAIHYEEVGKDVLGFLKD